MSPPKSLIQATVYKETRKTPQGVAADSLPSFLLVPSTPRRPLSWEGHSAPVPTVSVFSVGPPAPPHDPSLAFIVPAAPSSQLHRNKLVKPRVLASVDHHSRACMLAEVHGRPHALQDHDQIRVPIFLNSPRMERNQSSSGQGITVCSSSSTVPSKHITHTDVLFCTP